MRSTRLPWGRAPSLAMVALLFVGCDGAATASTQTLAPDARTDLLANIVERATILMATDPAYPPASFVVDGASRKTDTRCAQDELTAPEVDGYDVAVSRLVADGLGVEPCFVTPAWAELLAGNWADRWDLAFSSIGITAERMDTLRFTRPYYATPERFYVADTSVYRTMEQLDGKGIGVCTGCFADLYLQHKLTIPGTTVDYRVDDARIIGYQTERAGLDDVGAGTLDAFLCQETAGQAAIADGVAIRALEPAPYAAFPAGAVDRESGMDTTTLLKAVNDILGARFEDGTLAGLSERFFGRDYASAAATFDAEAIGP